jgi:hypothetical protein
MEYNLRQKYLDMQVSQREKAINRQVELAKAGLDNQLAYEQARLSKDVLEKRKLAEKEARQKEAIQWGQAYINAYNSELSRPNANPATAPALALKDVLLARGLAKAVSKIVALKDGTEDTGTVNNPLDSDGGRFAILHDNERVMSKKQNDLVGNITNDELANLAWKYQKGLIIDYKQTEQSTATNISNGILIQQHAEIIKPLKDIASKPSQQVEVDKFGNLIETIYEKGKKDIYIHKSRTRI